MAQRKDVSAARLRALMAEKGMTIPKMAQRTGDSERTVSRRLSDGFQIKGLFVYARVLKASAAYIAGDRDSPERPVWLREDQRLLLELFESLSTDGKRAALDTLQEARAAYKKARCG